MEGSKPFWTHRTYLVGAIAPFVTITELMKGHRFFGLGCALVWVGTWLAIAARHGLQSKSLKLVENACFGVAFLLLVWYLVLWWQAYLQGKPLRWSF